MLILLAVFLLFLNGFFVAAEFALVKVRATQLEGLVQQGNKAAKLAIHLVKNIDPYLSATQLGITLASLGLGWVGEPAVATLIKPLLESGGIKEGPFLNSISFVIAFTLISFLHIVVGEIAPKSFALVKPVETSLTVAWPMRFTYYVFYPFLIVLNGASNALLRLLGVPLQSTHSLAVSAEELYHMTTHSAAEGVLNVNQSELLSNVFTFSDRVASEIMAPHNRVCYVDVSTPIHEVWGKITKSGHSRFPLVEGSLDHVIGMLHIKDLLPLLLKNNIETPDLRKLARPVIYVPESMSAQKLLVELKQQRFHLAVVIDEYGGTSGVVSIEDVLEELVGDIQDEFDTETPDILKTETGYIIDGSASVNEVAKELSLSDIDTDSDTVNGLMMENLESIPKVNDMVEISNWKFKVLTMEGLRIGKLEAQPISTKSEKSV